MYSYTDFERLYLRYKLEGVPSGVSIEQFCLSNQVLYNLFSKWYKDTRKKIVPVQVLGAPSPEAEVQEIPSPLPERTPEVQTRLSSSTGLRILVDIRMSNGVHLSHKNLSYEGLKSLVDSDMTPEEKSKMIMELVAARERDAERIRCDEARIDALLSKVDELLSLQKAAMAAKKELDDYKQLVSNLLSKITALEERLKVRNKNLYGCKSQKGIRKKRVKDEEDHTRDKDDFDGTPQSIGSPSAEAGGEAVEEEGSEVKSKESHLYRQGLSYRTMSADNTVCHNSDIDRLPAGTVIIKLPFSGHPEIIDVVPGTHASGSRGRDALKHILGDSQVKALQSDGYNVYMYLDDHMVDIEHLCCMAHARVSAVYHTIISTCKMQGVAVLDYFKRFFSEIVKGRRDYEHLLPLTIGLN